MTRADAETEAEGIERLFYEASELESKHATKVLRVVVAEAILKAYDRGASDQREATRRGS